jgi:hypothetical protein
MNDSTAAGERLNVSGSMSQNVGRAPVRAMVPAVAKNVNGVVMTSSPGPISRAMSATSNASVPEETPMPYRHWQYAATLASSSRVAGPRMNAWLAHTFSMAARISP